MPDINESLAEFGLQIDVWPLERFKVYDRNPRTHSEQNIKAIVASIEGFGFKGAVLVDKDGEVIAGHGRIEAAKRKGLTKLPVLIANDLDQVKGKALRLADNRTAEMAAWDLPALRVEVEELQDMRFGIANLGFSDDELAAIQGDKHQFREYDASIAEGIKMCICQACGHEHVARL